MEFWGPTGPAGDTEGRIAGRIERAFSRNNFMVEREKRLGSYRFDMVVSGQEHQSLLGVGISSFNMPRKNEWTETEHAAVYFATAVSKLDIPGLAVVAVGHKYRIRAPF